MLPCARGTAAVLSSLAAEWLNRTRADGLLDNFEVLLDVELVLKNRKAFKQRQYR